ncbi:MAG TPA: tripartite tricarboxylate transporter substrate binding protein [Burkholderiales bacterium]|nr:tripartite tricarboxylate transporter substrate binding protein [Burkholderiales bacterium]
MGHPAILIFLAGLASSPFALAQSYPTKPVRMVVGFPPGGPSDLVARTLAQKLSASLGQQVIVENRAGAGGVIAAEQVAKSPPDGYTLLHGTIGSVAVAMSLNPNRGFDTLRDFAPITQNVAVTNILITHPSVPAKSVKELLALARTRQGRLNYGSSGPGTLPHLAGELLKLMAKVEITHIAYKGSAPSFTALLSGEVDMSFENSLIALPQIRQGKVRALAVTGERRSKLLPDLPTIAEAAGLPGYGASGWYGLLAPAATPKAVVARLHAETVQALRQPDVVERLSGQGAEPVGNTPQEFGAFIRSEIDKWARLVKAANMKVE